MDCTRFQDLKAAMPNCREQDFLAHLEDCPCCGKFASEIDCMEALLLRTVEVDPPAGFMEHMLLHATPSMNWAQRLLARFGLGGVGPGTGLGIVSGAFASVAVVSITAILFLRQSPAIDPLVAELVTHVQSESHFMHDTMHVEPGALSVAFETYGAQIKAPIGEVRHLGTCLVNGQLGHHVYVKTPEGEATLILLPGKGSDVTSPQSSQGMSGLIIGLNKGRMGIIADSPARVQNVKRWISPRIEVQG